jgi:hypothetical protein
MVFPHGAAAGQAKVVWRSHTIASTENLIVEAVKLWEAEARERDTVRTAAGWGCVALLCNPERKIPADILNGWATRLEREPGYGNVSQAADEGLLISKDGILQVDWPRRVEDGAAINLDLLLMTANDPTPGAPLAYPSIRRMVRAWNDADQDHVEYFWKNTDHGITTFQDDKISAGPRPRRQEQA